VLVPFDEAHDDRHFIFVKSLLQSTKPVFLLGLEDSASAVPAVLEKVLKNRKSVVLPKAKEDFFVDFRRKKRCLAPPQGEPWLSYPFWARCGSKIRQIHDRRWQQVTLAGD
jgi:hypothetical protein